MARRLFDRLPEVSPRRFELVALFALAFLSLIVLTGAAVRLTGSGLGCPNWPKCGEGFVAPLESRAWIEYGNRIASFLVGVASLVAGIAAWRRRPFRRDLAVVGLLLPFGVLLQGVLGGLTVIFELKPGFVMGHFGLSMLILVAAFTLFWLSRREPGDVRPAEDPAVVRATRVLLPIAALVIFVGMLATAAGPHAGQSEDQEPVGRLNLIGTLDTVIHWHGRAGTLLGLSALAVWFLARRRGAGHELRRALTALCLLVAAQGVIGFIQYELELPAAVVWMHILVATGTWLAVLFAVAAAGRLRPADARTPVQAAPEASPVLGTPDPHMR